MAATVDELITILGVRGLANYTTAFNTASEATRKLAVEQQMIADRSLLVSSSLNSIASSMIAFEKGAVMAAGQMDQMKVTLTAMLGSAGAAGRELEALKQLAESPAFTLQSAFQGTQTLYRYVGSMEKARAMMYGLAITATAAGKSNDALMRAQLALTQVFMKGKLQGDELIQFAEAGVPVMDILGKATGKTYQEIQKMGQTAEGTKYLMDLLFRGILEDAGMVNKMKANTDSLSNALLNLQDAAFYAKSALGQALLDPAKQSINALAELLKGVDKLPPSVQRWAGAMLAAVTVTAKVGAEVLKLMAMLAQLRIAKLAQIAVNETQATSEGILALAQSASAASSANEARAEVGAVGAKTADTIATEANTAAQAKNAIVRQFNWKGLVGGIAAITALTILFANLDKILKAIGIGGKGPAAPDLKGMADLFNTGAPPGIGAKPPEQVPLVKAMMDMINTEQERISKQRAFRSLPGILDKTGMTLQGPLNLAYQKDIIAAEMAVKQAKTEDDKQKAMKAYFDLQTQYNQEWLKVYEEVGKEAEKSVQKSRLEVDLEQAKLDLMEKRGATIAEIADQEKRISDLLRDQIKATGNLAGTQTLLQDPEKAKQAEIDKVQAETQLEEVGGRAAQREKERRDKEREDRRRAWDEQMKRVQLWDQASIGKAVFGLGGGQGFSDLLAPVHRMVPGAGVGKQDVAARLQAAMDRSTDQTANKLAGAVEDILTRFGYKMVQSVERGGQRAITGGSRFRP